MKCIVGTIGMTMLLPILVDGEDASSVDVLHEAEMARESRGSLGKAEVPAPRTVAHISRTNQKLRPAADATAFGISPIGMTEEGFQLEVTGEAGGFGRIEATQGFEQWTVIESFSFQESPLTYVDTKSGQYSHRFYRILQEYVVYDNTFNTTGRFLTSDFEIGDELGLEGEARRVTRFRVEVYAADVDDNANGVLRFYANDGESVGPARAPETLLYESDPFPVEDGTFVHTVSNLSVRVPDTFTWTLEFFDLGEGEAGVTFADPPEVGSSFSDYWRNTEDGWNTFIFPNEEPPANFVSKVWAVDAPLTDVATQGGSVTPHYTDGGAKAVLQSVPSDSQAHERVTAEPVRAVRDVTSQEKRSPSSAQ